MSRVVHFEIPADDPERAIRFYEQALGWKVNKWEGPMDYWLVDTGEGEGISGAIMRREPPASGTVNTVCIPSIDDTADKVRSLGGETLTEKSHIPGVGYFMYCRDPEGNVFGIMQPDEPEA